MRLVRFALPLFALLLLAPPATAQTQLETVTGHRSTIQEIRFCRLTGGGPAFVGCLHAAEGHRQGTSGHMWADYQSQARQLRRFINGLLRPSCDGPASCVAMVRVLAPRYGVSAQSAVNVMLCESGGNPNAYNPSSGASGLFQQLARYWPGRAATYGHAGASPFDGYANASVSLGMIRDTGGYSHWVCQP